MPRKPRSPDPPLRHAARWKPKRFQHYLTLGEVVRELNKDRDWIVQLEKDGRIPEAKRVKHGQLSIRLFSPEQVEEMREIFAAMRPGPKGR